jgi:putative ABC transport system substrate-binding protein
MTRAPRVPSVSRRRIVVALSAFPFATVAWPQARRKRLGVLVPGHDPGGVRQYLEPLLAALRKLGWEEGRTLDVMWKVIGQRTPANPRPWELLPRLAQEIVAWWPDCVVTQGTFATRAMARASRTIPIVTHTGDPVASGFAASLARPGGNVTGFSSGYGDMATKSIEVLRAMVPGLQRLAICHWRDESFADLAGLVAASSRAASVEPMLVAIEPVSPDLLARLGELRALGVQAAIYSSGIPERLYSELASAAIRERVPLWTLADPGMVAAGLLGALETIDAATDEQFAACIDRIFRGANPADMPIQFPQRFRLVINRKTAQALELRIPPEVLLRADEVIG